MIDTWRQQKAIIAVEPFVVVTVPPRLAVTRTQVLGIGNSSYAAPHLNLTHTLPKEPLSATRQHDRLLLGSRDARVAKNLLLQMLFPDDGVLSWQDPRWLILDCEWPRIQTLVGFHTDQTRERSKQRLWHLGQIDRLTAVA